MPTIVGDAAHPADEPRRCWHPSCNERATVKDWSGWYWCDEHAEIVVTAAPAGVDRPLTAVRNHRPKSHN